MSRRNANFIQTGESLLIFKLELSLFVTKKIE